MKILDFPGPPDPELAELEAALFGDADGPRAAAWRELRDDVRALAEPIDPAFQERLASSFAARRQDPLKARRKLSPRLQAPLARRRTLAGLTAALAALVAGVVIAGPFASHSSSPVVRSGAAVESSSAPPHADFKHSAPVAEPTPSATASPATGPSSAATRVQELGATITLGASAGEVQQVADGASRLASTEGGFVERSQVEQSGKNGEATLQLSVPSARLSRTLAALARLAPVRAESQSLQDITDSYEAAKRGLSDAVAERTALLRALAKASTQGQIESLRRRLSLAGGSIERARLKLGALSQRAANSSVTVTVVSSGQSSSEGLTLHRGLHDAGRVLTVALIVVLIGLAALIPALFVLGLVALATRRVRRGLRERALS